MLTKSSSARALQTSKSGQAMIEFIPAILIFFIIIITSVVFFQGLRESSEMQEAARNAAFAKISNSGPLVSKGGAIQGTNYYNFPNLTASSPPITNTNVCFTATPEQGVTQAVLPTVMGLGMNLTRAHKATVFRQPADPTSCN